MSSLQDSGYTTQAGHLPCGRVIHTKCLESTSVPRGYARSSDLDPDMDSNVQLPISSHHRGGYDLVAARDAVPSVVKTFPRGSIQAAFAASTRHADRATDPPKVAADGISDASAKRSMKSHGSPKPKKTRNVKSKRGAEPEERRADGLVLRKGTCAEKHAETQPNAMNIVAGDADQGSGERSVTKEGKHHRTLYIAADPDILATEQKPAEGAMDAPGAKAAEEPAECAGESVYTAPPADGPHPVAIPVPMYGDKLSCNWCGIAVDMSKVRMTSHKQGKCKCLRCCATFTKCYGHYRQWPTPEFNAIPCEDQTDFYVKASSMTTTRQVIKLMETKLENYEMRQSAWALGGRHLPLSVWQEQGFDIKRIVLNSKPEDIQENPQAGTCYRVRIYSSAQGGTTGCQFDQSLSATSGEAHPRLETKRQIQYRTTKEKQNERDAQKSASATKWHADKLLKSLAGPVEELTTALASDAAVHFEESLKDDASSLQDQAKAIQKELNYVIEHPMESSDISKYAEVTRILGNGFNRLILLQVHRQVCFMMRYRSILILVS